MLEIVIDKQDILLLTRDFRFRQNVRAGKCDTSKFVIYLYTNQQDAESYLTVFIDPLGYVVNL